MSAADGNQSGVRMTTSPTRAALVAEIEADRAQGTPGPWHVTHCQYGYAHCDYHGVSSGSFAQGAGFDATDARRITRVPDMEAQIIADAAYIAELEERLTSERMAGHDLAKNEYRDTIAELEAALAPFARIPDPRNPNAWLDEHPIWARNGVILTVGDFARARRTLNQDKEDLATYAGHVVRQATRIAELEAAMRHLIDMIEAQKRHITPSPKRESYDDMNSRLESDAVFGDAIVRAERALVMEKADE